MRHARRTTVHTAAMLASAIAAAASFSNPARAASGTWTGAVDAHWENPGNWNTVPGVADGTKVSPDVATFNGAATSTSVTVDPSRNVAGITFDNIADTSTPFTIGSATGNALTLSAGGAIQATPSVSIASGVTASMNIAAPLVLAGSTYSFTNNAPTGPATTPGTGSTLRISGPVTAGGTSPTTLTLDGSNSAGLNSGIFSSVGGVMSDGAGAAKLGIFKTGSGSWELNTTGQNTYSGPTVIDQGLVRFVSVGSLSPNTDVTVNAAGIWRSSIAGVTARSLTMNRGAGFSVSTSASHTIVLNTNAGPAIQLNYAGGNNGVQLAAPFSLTGTTQLTGGITLVADAQTPQINIGATTSPFDLGSVVRPMSIDKGNPANVGFDLRIRGPVSGAGTAGGILKLGQGSMRLDNATQNWAGTLEVREGQFSFSSSGAMTGNVALSVTGGDLRITGGTTQTFSSATMTKGLISRSDAVSTIKAPAFTLNVAASDSASIDPIIADATAGTTVTKNGAGTATLSGANTYTGATAANAGTLVLKGSGARTNVLSGAGATVQSGATLSFDYDGAGGGGTVQGQIVTLLHDGKASNFSSGPIRAGAPAATRGFGWRDDGNAVLITPAYYGDLNLDGKVNGDDYALIDRSVANGGSPGTAQWVNGDVDYSKTVDQNDYMLMDTTYGTSGVPREAFAALLAERESQFGSAYVAALTAAVPEPGSAILCLVAAPLLARRRRR
jgi:fibronectin-binding autotransporter adhesin